MKNKINKVFYWTIGLILLAHINLSNAAIDFWGAKVNQWISGTGTETADVTIQKIVQNLMSFLYVVAILYALYGWFKILTAWWEEDWVKTWKTILIQAALWMLVIFISGSIINWLLTLILK